jgi:hypothetical protein
MADFVLVHSPLVGPTTWRWVAENLAARGHQATVPAARSRDWEAFADMVVALTGRVEQPVLVGHSGAGPLLPQIAARASWAPAAVVFVDAGVPPDSGQVELMPEEILADIRPLAKDGMLPPWSDWFGQAVMEELIPPADRREAVQADLPRLPLSYFSGHVPVPDGWSTARCGYVQLSEAYAAEAATAAGRGWPVVERIGAHLDIVTKPAVVADAILAAAGLSG